jgi:hypothetical protein
MYDGRCSAITNVLVTTERAISRYDKAFLFNDKSEVDFGIAYPYTYIYICIYRLQVAEFTFSQFIFSPGPRLSV